MNELKLLKKEFAEAKRKLNPVYKTIENLKNGAFKQVNPKLGEWMGVGTGLLSLGFTTFLIKKNEEIQEIELRTADVRDAEFGRLFQRSLKNLTEIKNLTTKVNNIEKVYKTGIDKIYAEAASAAKNATEARQKANDALYETRANKPKLEAQIAEAKKKSNDALYETRTGRTKLEDKIAQVQSQVNKFTQGVTGNFQAKIEVTIGIIQKDLQNTNSRVSNIEKAKPAFQNKVIQTVQDSVKKVGNDLGLAVARLAQLEKLPPEIKQVQSEIKQVQSEVKYLKTEQPKQWGVTVTQAVVTQAKVTSSLVENAVKTFEAKHATITKSWFSATEWVGRYGAKTADLVTNGADRLYKNDEVLSGGIAAVATNVDQRIKKLEQQGLQVSDPAVGGLIRSVNNLRTDLEQVKINEKKIGADVDILTTKIKEQEKVNQAAIPKLDQMLGLLLLIPARTANAIRPSIPTIPQIETASSTGTCRTLQPGGCSRKAFDDLGNGINQNTNNQSNNLLDKLNAGANATQLGLLKVIDNKLGDQIKGGLSGKLVDGFKWLKLDRALSILTFAATVQNHVMLSNSIGTTLLGAFGNVLSLIGLKDDQGQAYDVGSVINSSIESFVKSIVGAENYATISEAWAKANRIYQATTNVLNAFQGLSSTILNGMELIAGNNSKIGNALKKAGIVLETAYGWMNPQPKFNRLTQILEKFQAGASTIQMVTQAPLDIINATTELQNANTELIKAFKEDNKPENKAPEIPEPDGLKTKETESKAASQPLTFNFSDLFYGED